MQEQLDILLDQFKYLQSQSFFFSRSLPTSRLSNAPPSAGIKEIYRERGDRQTNEEAKDLQKVLKPVFESIADFLNVSARYYQR